MRGFIVRVADLPTLLSDYTLPEPKVVVVQKPHMSFHGLSGGSRICVR